MTSRRRIALALLLVAAPAATACSGSDTTAPRSTTTTTTTTTGAAAAVPEGTAEGTAGEECTPPEIAGPLRAAAVEGSTVDLDVAAFDDVPIRAHWFPHPEATPEQPAPTVLMGPGWSLAGDTDPDQVGVLGAINIGSLRDAGYNVLTWDPRGFGASGGSAQVNDPAHEGRDVQHLIEWVSVQPGVQLDGARDPRMGMVGGSYGGGIQLVAAAIDCRVDAIVPIMAWHSLLSSLYRSETVKTGWAGLLTDVSAGSTVDPHVTGANSRGQATGTMDAESVEWFDARGPGDLVADITAPTLLIQGTVDTLFTLSEAVTNQRILEDNGVPTAMLWYCGGHGVCLTEPGDPERVSRAALTWLDRWVKDDPAVDTGPAFDVIDQHGVRFVADSLPGPDSRLTGSGSGTLRLVAEGGAGPAVIPPDVVDLLAGLAGPILPGPATNAVEATVRPGDRTVQVLGAPVVRLTYSGTVPDGDSTVPDGDSTVPDGERPTRIFAQLVDDATGLVIGNQITPIPVVLDGERHTTEVPLEMVAFTAEAGSTVTLQLVATTVAYAEPRLGGSVDLAEVEVELPVVDDLRPAPS